MKRKNINPLRLVKICSCFDPYINCEDYVQNTAKYIADRKDNETITVVITCFLPQTVTTNFLYGHLHYYYVPDRNNQQTATVLSKYFEIKAESPTKCNRKSQKCECISGIDKLFKKQINVLKIVVLYEQL